MKERKTAIFKSTLFLEHDPGFDHVESPLRLSSLYEECALINKASFIEPQFSPASVDTLSLNHSKELIRAVSATEGKMFSVLDGDTFTSKRSYSAACLAAGALVCGVDLLTKGSINNGFALSRPPGHHAERGTSTGFCLFNNIAIAARYARLQYGYERILIIDWDVHHGNGTQNSFFDTDGVFYISIHQYPLYPGTGALAQVGKDRGEGYTINIPLPGGQGDEEYANIFNTLITPMALQYKPDLILVSAGFDGHCTDGISTMRLTHRGYSYMTKIVVELAELLCQGRILFTLEGGYSINGLKEGVFSVLSTLAGEPLNTSFSSSLDEEDEKRLRSERTPHPAIENVREVAKKYWKL